MDGETEAFYFDSVFLSLNDNSWKTNYNNLLSDLISLAESHTSGMSLRKVESAMLDEAELFFVKWKQVIKKPDNSRLVNIRSFQVTFLVRVKTKGISLSCYLRLAGPLPRICMSLLFSGKKNRTKTNKQKPSLLAEILTSLNFQFGSWSSAQRIPLGFGPIRSGLKQWLPTHKERNTLVAISIYFSLCVHVKEREGRQVGKRTIITRLVFMWDRFLLLWKHWPQPQQPYNLEALQWSTAIFLGCPVWQP